jgi:hypothetical protein
MTQERVPCPVDPTHTIFKAQLKSHVKVCNKSKRITELESKPFFSRNINSGKTELCIECSTTNDDDLSTTPTTATASKEITFSEVVKLVELLYVKCFPADSDKLDGIEFRFSRAKECEDYLALSASTEQSKNRRAAYRHLLQQVKRKQKKFIY